MTALIVPVSLPAAVEQFRLAHVPTARDGMPAHVTLLYPFLEATAIDAAVRTRIAAVAGAHRGFAFRLSGIERWPSSAHLRVEPAAPFEALVAALVQAFPDYPPYAGEYPFVPHVSLAEDDPNASFGPIEADLERLAAETFRAESVVFVARERGRWLDAAAFPLGRP